ncbi:MAG TPA: Arm DNA-binding domain-containing protein, partial [Alphaproteobacteria bacterium]
MKKRLTDRYLATVKPPATGRLQITDTEAPGLMFRLTGKGIASWSIRYRPKGAMRRRATYGTYPSIKLADARQRAKDIDAAAGKGIDLVELEERQRLLAGNG